MSYGVGGNEEAILHVDEARHAALVREFNEIELRRWVRNEVAENPEWARAIRDTLSAALEEAVIPIPKGAKP